jgi:putative transposase
VSTPEQDDVRRRQRAQQVALVRYQLICPALDPDLSTKARERIVRALAGQPHAGPFGGQQWYSRHILDRWIRRYRAGGFDALTPSIRQPGSRIDTSVLEMAVALKRGAPDHAAVGAERPTMPLSGRSARPCRCRGGAPDHAAVGAERPTMPLSGLMPNPVHAHRAAQDRLAADASQAT